MFDSDSELQEMHGVCFMLQKCVCFIRMEKVGRLQELTLLGILYFGDGVLLLALADLKLCL